MHAFLCSLHPRRYGHLVITTSDQQFVGLTVAFCLRRRRSEPSVRTIQMV